MRATLEWQDRLQLPGANRCASFAALAAGDEENRDPAALQGRTERG